MDASAAFRQAMADGSVADVRRLWAAVFPHLPQPASDAEAAVMMHHARTQTESLPLRPRAYSHRWLVERGLSSGLPDELRPRAERMYPVIADAVGIAVGSSSRRHREEAKAIEGAMSTKVKEMYADGDKEPTLVKREIMRVYEKWRG